MAESDTTTLPPSAVRQTADPPLPATNDATGKPSVEELLNDLPNPNPPPLPQWYEPELRHMPRGSDEGQPPITADGAWRKCDHLVEQHDKNLCDSYREQVDTLLVFAGLFSAVVTAFAVVSLQWLQDDPSERVAELLQQAVSLLAVAAHQTAPAVPQRQPPLPNSIAVRINVYWFLSLSLSLSAALVGILCKQWIREYERNAGKSIPEALGVRQMKLEGLEAWGVGAIVTSVPLLLQTALALFFVGVSQLLWHLNHAVATAVIIAAGLTGAFYIITACLPFLPYAVLVVLRVVHGPSSWPQCPYKSPQAWLIFRLYRTFIRLSASLGLSQSESTDSWSALDIAWMAQQDLGTEGLTATCRALAWILKTLGEPHLTAWVLLCLRQHITLEYTASLLRSEIGHSSTGYAHVAQCGRGPEDELSQSILNSLHGHLDHFSFEMTATSSLVALFECSCRSDLNINTSLELLLQIFDLEPFNAGYLSAALRLICYTFQPTRPIVNDDLALALIKTEEVALSSSNRYEPNDLTSFFEFTTRLLRRAPSSATLLPAFCGITLRLLKSADGDINAAFAVLFSLCHVQPYTPQTSHMHVILLPRGFPDDIRQLPGFHHIAALAQFIIASEPARRDDETTQEMLAALQLSYLCESDASAREDETRVGEEPAEPPTATHFVKDVTPLAPAPTVDPASSGRPAPAHMSITVETDTGTTVRRVVDEELQAADTNVSRAASGTPAVPPSTSALDPGAVSEMS